MASEKQNNSSLHRRNRNQERYNLAAMVQALPDLKPFVSRTKYGLDSIDFSNPKAVKLLNRALLKQYYGIQNWDFPEQNLCPPIPGRADYIHHLADLLSNDNKGEIPRGNAITCLDIGTGASCIYPILGIIEYSWNFIGSDIDPKSISSVKHIIEVNNSLHGKLDIRLQKDPKHIFKGILGKDEKIDICLCNPPFHSSRQDAEKGTRRKIKNLSGKLMTQPPLNFAGVSNELIYEGGEFEFIRNMIVESREFAKHCKWFTSLVSKQSNLKGIYKLLKDTEAKDVKTIPMGTGNKSTRIVAWRFW